MCFRVLSSQWKMFHTGAIFLGAAVGGGVASFLGSSFANLASSENNSFIRNQ